MSLYLALTSLLQKAQKSLILNTVQEECVITHYKQHLRASY